MNCDKENRLVRKKEAVERSSARNCSSAWFPGSSTVAFVDQFLNNFQGLVKNDYSCKRRIKSFCIYQPFPDPSGQVKLAARPVFLHFAWQILPLHFTVNSSALALYISKKSVLQVGPSSSVRLDSPSGASKFPAACFAPREQLASTTFGTTFFFLQIIG